MEISSQQWEKGLDSYLPTETENKMCQVAGFSGFPPKQVAEKVFQMVLWGLSQIQQTSMFKNPMFTEEPGWYKKNVKTDNFMYLCFLNYIMKGC